MIESILLVGVFGAFLVSLIIIGGFSFFFTHQAIDVSLKFSKKINVFKKEPPIDPDGIVMYSYYRTVGFLMLLVAGLPLMLMICLTLKTISEGGRACIGNDYNCIQF